MIIEISNTKFTSCRLIFSKSLLAIGFYLDFSKSQPMTTHRKVITLQIDFPFIRFWYIKYKKSL